MNKPLAQLKADAKRAGWLEWIKTEADERALLEGCTFKPALGEHVCTFFERFLCLGEGVAAGQPFRPLPWQREVLMMLFGWLQPDGSRRFRDAFVSTAKKNGKSPLAAGIGLYLLIGDNEPGAKICSAATEIKQANIVHADAIRMVNASRGLAAKLAINRTTSAIYRRDDPSCWYRAFSGEAESKEGYNLHGAIGDELHVWANYKLLDTLRYAFAARRQPLFFKITTAGVYDETSAGWEEYQRAKQVLTGEVADQQKYVYIAEADKKDKWTSETVWQKANPSLGYVLQLDEIAKACKDAQETPRLEHEFRRYRLNQWVDQAVQWLPVEQWQACSGAPNIPKGAVVVAGGDLSSVSDLTALMIIHRDAQEVYHVEPYFWLPEATVTDRRHKNHTLYQQWMKQGHLEVTPQNAVDYAFIRRRINELAKQYTMTEIALDPWNAGQVINDLEQYDGFIVVQVRQGYGSLNEPSKELERLLADGRMRHGGHPILDWMAQHVAVITNVDGNIRPVKPLQSEHRKIDGITALVTGLSRAMLRPSVKRSKYETQGLMSVTTTR